MGMVFGKIDVETPKFQLLQSSDDYEIRKYSSRVVAEVTYNTSQFGGRRDGGFMVLANYIGALGQPHNTKPEKIAMTAPVITTSSVTVLLHDTDIAAIDQKTANEITVSDVAMARSNQQDMEEKNKIINPMVTMQFVLPSKYKKVEEAPNPVNELVVIREEVEKLYGVVKFSGVATDSVVEERVEKLKRTLERDGHKVMGQYLLARYNPPWTLPPFRTNEIMIPIELATC